MHREEVTMWPRALSSSKVTSGINNCIHSHSLVCMLSKNYSLIWIVVYISKLLFIGHCHSCNVSVVSIAALE